MQGGSLVTYPILTTSELPMYIYALVMREKAETNSNLNAMFVGFLASREVYMQFTAVEAYLNKTKIAQVRHH